MKHPTCATCGWLLTRERQDSSRSWSVSHACGNMKIDQRGPIDPETFSCAQHTDRVPTTTATEAGC